MTEKTEREIWKDIISGKYRDYYLIYNRKSTDENYNQKNSIRVQKETNLKYANTPGKKVLIAQITITGFCANGVISEKHSGFKENSTLTFTTNGMAQFSVDRPKFLKLVELLSKKLFKGIICLCWDRLSRNKGDDTIIGKLIKSGIDIQFVYAHYDKSSSGLLHMDIDGMFAAHHSRVTSEKVKITTHNLRNKGLCTYRAPVGYLNEGNTERKPIDPIRGPIIKKMFELYAKGKVSVADLARIANSEGFTTVPMRPRRTVVEMLAEDEEDEDGKEKKVPKISRPLLANNVQKILVNKFYTGKMLGNNRVWVKSISHEALVTDEIFEKVQLMLRKKKVSVYYPDRVESLYRGIARCNECGRVYTPYKQKGIQYYGARCQSDCKNTKKSFNITFLEKEVEKLIFNISLTDEEVEELDKQNQTDLVTLEENRLSEIETSDRKKRKLREDLTYFKTNKLSLLKSGVYSPEAYLEEEERINKSLKELQDAEKISDVTAQEIIKDLIKLSELVKYGYEHVRYANPEEKEQIIRIIVSELSLFENTLTCKGRNGIRVLQNRKHSFCDPTESRTPVNRLKTCCPNH